MIFQNFNILLMYRNKILFFFSICSAINFACIFNFSYVNHLSLQVFVYAVFLAITLSSILVQTSIFDHHYYNSQDYHNSVKFRKCIKFGNNIVSIISIGITLHYIYGFFLSYYIRCSVIIYELLSKKYLFVWK